MDVQRKDSKQNSIKQKAKGLAIIFSLVVGLLIYVRTLEPAGLSVARSQLWIDTVKFGEMVREVRGPGRLVSKEIRVLASESNARVVEIFLRAGDQVTPDSKILKLSNPELLEQLAVAEQSLANHQAEFSTQKTELERQLIEQRKAIAGAEVQYKIAAMQTERELKLVEKGIIPEIQSKRNEIITEQLKYLHQLEKEQLDSLQESVDIQLNASLIQRTTLENTVRLRKSQVDALSVTAVQFGILQDVNVEVGQQVLSGTNLARIAGTTDIIAQLRIPESQIKDVKHGLAATIDTRSGIVEGLVSRIDPSVENGAIVVDIELKSELPGTVRPSLNVDGVIQIDKLSDILYVGRPSRSTRNSEITMFKIDKNRSIAERINVELGRVTASNVEIVTGLKEGDRVILSDTSEWNEHSVININ